MVWILQSEGILFPWPAGQCRNVFGWVQLEFGPSLLQETFQLRYLQFQMSRTISRRCWEKNPFGLSGSSFLMIYESCVGQLNLKQLQCKDLVELSCCRTVVCPSSVLCRGVVVLGGGDCTASWGDGLQRYQ